MSVQVNMENEGGTHEAREETTDGLQHLTEKEKKKLKEDFRKLDKIDGQADGKVCVRKFSDVIHRLEKRKSWFYMGRQTQRLDSQVSAEMHALDVDGDGNVSEGEMLSYADRKKGEQNQNSQNPDEEAQVGQQGRAGVLEYVRIIARAKQIKKWPPPLFIPLCALLQLIIFIVDKTDCCFGDIDYLEFKW